MTQDTILIVASGLLVNLIMFAFFYGGISARLYAVEKQVDRIARKVWPIRDDCDD